MVDPLLLTTSHARRVCFNHSPHSSDRGPLLRFHLLFHPTKEERMGLSQVTSIPSARRARYQCFGFNYVWPCGLILWNPSRTQDFWSGAPCLAKPHWLRLAHPSSMSIEMPYVPVCLFTSICTRYPATMPTMVHVLCSTIVNVPLRYPVSFLHPDTRHLVSAAIALIKRTKHNIPLTKGSDDRILRLWASVPVRKQKATLVYNKDTLTVCRQSICYDCKYDSQKDYAP